MRSTGWSAIGPGFLMTTRSTRVSRLTHGRKAPGPPLSPTSTRPTTTPATPRPSSRYHLGVDLTNLIGSTAPGEGKKLRTTVRYCDAFGCPMENAFWNGQGAYFGETFAQADDIVGHELAHGVTDFTSRLLPWYQSGAINESMSDVFGELIDLTNSDDETEPAWELGEGSSAGPGRDMKNPGRFGDPDRMTSGLYAADPDLFDNGEIHTNSGVGNKAAYLIAEPGTRTFNGQTITGLGYVEAAKIYYQAEQLLTSGADYQDLYSVLPQACKNLAAVAGSGIVAQDCVSVTEAVTATEMNKQPTNSDAKAPEALVGCTSATKKNLFQEGFEGTSLSDWTFTAAMWQSIDYYAKTGTGSLYGIEPDTARSIFATLDTSFLIPGGGAKTYLRFDHQYLLEYNAGGEDFPRRYYDGARLEYSVNQNAWTNAANLPWSNGPSKTIRPDNTSTTYTAFGGDSHGYQGSRVDLSSLANKRVRFRWRVTGDSTFAFDGWTLDNINLYSCRVPTKVTAAISPAVINYGSSAKISGKLTRSDTGAAIAIKAVHLYGKTVTGSTYSLLGSATTNSAGSYSFSVKPSVGTDYYVERPESTSYVESRSSSVSLRVRVKVTAHFADSTVGRNVVAVLSGSVSPKHAGQTVQVQELSGGRWQTIGTATLNSSSIYQFPISKSTAGTYSFRVHRPGDSDHWSGTSPTVKLTVS